MATGSHSAVLAAVLGCVGDGVLTVDAHFRITSFNRAAEQITGVPAREALGKRCAEVLRADVCGNGCAIRKVLESGGKVVDHPARIVVGRGGPAAISLSAEALRDDEGELLGAVEAFRARAAGESRTGAVGQGEPSTLARAESDVIRRVLSATGGRVGIAAKKLGISRTTLWRKMKKYGIRVGR
jgi:PAS domain S-box-containing protein